MTEEMRAWADRVAAHARAKGLAIHTQDDIIAAARDYLATSEGLTILVLTARGDGWQPTPEAGDLIVGWLADITYDEIRKEAGL